MGRKVINYVLMMDAQLLILKIVCTMWARYSVFKWRFLKFE